MAYRRIFHPTDYTESSEKAFHHALAIVLASRGIASIMHVDPPQSQQTWEKFPRVRGTLIRWGLLPPGAQRSEIAKLGIGVKKTIATGQDPRKAMISYLEEHRTHLMVVATYQRTGLAKFFQPSISGSVARATGIPTLFVPAGGGFIDPATGKTSLDHILIPTDLSQATDAAIEAARELAVLVGNPDTRFTLLHIGSGEPEISLPEGNWRALTATGPLVETMIDRAGQLACDCMVMVTRGRKGLLDKLVGSTTEQIIQQAPCPILALNL